MLVTHEYVQRRFADFVAKYRQALETLNFAPSAVDADVANLQRRLNANDFKLYGDRPINFLHAGKRITRFYLKLAISTCPQMKARAARLRAEYVLRVAEARKLNSCDRFFSFESVYAGQLKPNLRQHRKLFYI